MQLINALLDFIGDEIVAWSRMLGQASEMRSEGSAYGCEKGLHR